MAWERLLRWLHGFPLAWLGQWSWGSDLECKRSNSEAERGPERARIKQRSEGLRLSLSEDSNGGEGKADTEERRWLHKTEPHCQPPLHTPWGHWLRYQENEFSCLRGRRMLKLFLQEGVSDDWEPGSGVCTVTCNIQSLSSLGEQSRGSCGPVSQMMVPGSCPSS